MDSVKKKVKVMTVDDHRAMSIGFEGMFPKVNGFELTYVGHAVSGQDAIDLFQETMPDLVILDLTLADMHGVEVATKLRDISGDVRIIIYTGELNSYKYINDLNDIGVLGLVGKQDRPEVLLRAIENVIDGYTVIPSNLFHQMRYEKRSNHGLSDLDMELLVLLEEKKTVRQIASIQSKSKSGVEYHLTQLYRKMSVDGRTEAVEKAKSLGLI